MDLADRTVMLLGASGQANVRALAGSKAPALADAAWRLLATDDALRQQIISVGLPIVAPDGKSSGSDVEWNAIEPQDPIEPSRFATWVFTVEDKGTRIKR